MNIQLDDGLQFGIGIFSTINLKGKTPEHLEWHLQRMNHSLEYFGIGQRICAEEVEAWLKDQGEAPEQAMKILVTEQNKLFLMRHNPYTPEQIKKGFQLEYSPILRNETSPFVYHKTINYGDNILEKRRIVKNAADEVVFLNTKGEICEGSTTNIFFEKGGVLYTPHRDCGLLPGVMRRYVIERMGARETIIRPEDVKEMEKCFVTNSLMGIMPVTRLGEMSFGDVVDRQKN